jgi:hypothetical protein
MNASGGKTFSFFSGILIGVLAGLGLVFLLLNGFNPYSVFNSGDDPDPRDTLVDLRQNSRTETLGKRKAESETTQEITPVFNDTLQSDLEQDSALLDRSDDISLVTEEIVVKRDELLETRELKLIALDKNSSKNKTDSLIKVFQGASSNAIGYRIEFWRSPINYRGFKFVRNAIVTFGLDPREISRLYQLEDKIYLRHGSFVYRLFITETFDSFSRVSDDNLIKQLR